TADNLARAITLQRMNQIYWAVVNYTQQRRGEFWRKDKWVLADKVIADALKHQNSDARWAKDAWGKPFRIVAQEKATNNPMGQPQFQFHELLSAGPDRQFGTQDDLKLADLQTLQRFGGGSWWYLDQDRLTNQVQFGMPGGIGGRPMVFGLERAAGMRGLDGGAVPMAAPRFARTGMKDAAEAGQAANGGGSGTATQAAAVKVRE